MVLDVGPKSIEKFKPILEKAKLVFLNGPLGVSEFKNEKDLQVAKELADLLGGVVACSRPLCENGLMNVRYQIGLSGKTVSPKLYIACGISGAVQHRAGMDQSAKIISINTDPNAPINSIADYTIIGDAMDIIPKMIKSYKNNML